MQDIVFADVNNNSHLDVLMLRGAWGSNGFRVFYNDGTGSLANSQTFYDADTNSDNSGSIVVGDFTGNGFVDVAYTMLGGKIGVRLNDGTGSFGPLVEYNAGGSVSGINVGDFNNNGFLDIIASGSDGLKYFEGRGDGTFEDYVAFGSGSGSVVEVFDFNNDGNLDIMTGTNTGNGPRIHFGNGDGTFTAQPTLGGANDFRLHDFDGDGVPDFIWFGGTSTYLQLGLGDGTFDSPIVSDVVKRASVAIGDLNGDGIPDFASRNRIDGTIELFYAVTTPHLDLREISLATQNESRVALSMMSLAHEGIVNELGSLGAQQSSLDTAKNNLEISRTTVSEAEDRIMSADIAEESAQLVKARILQQSAGALLNLVQLENNLVLSLLAD
jgi:flagellin-like hook-associated protein FlgL